MKKEPSTSTFNWIMSLLWLDVVKDLLQCYGAVLDAIQVDKHQKTCERGNRRDDGS